MAQEYECPSCQEKVTYAGTVPGMLACPSCMASFVPRGAKSVVLQIQTDGGHTKDLGTIALTPEFRERWLLGKLLGRGAMGMVFEAHDMKEGKAPVAIKFLTGVDDAAVLQRFLREGRLTLSIHHPNVVKVYELAEMGGHPYLVTELMPGGTLRNKLNREKKLSIEDTLRISRDCLLGLGAVHTMGIVHRDMKPENILFAADGTAKIADFGIAKDQTDKEKMTQTGQLLGTPQYISPEQIKNAGITRAADIYSFGVMMYEMLAGKPPFASSDVFNLLMQQVSKTPPHIKDARPDVPDDLASLIHRCLAKEASARPPAAEQIAAALVLSGQAHTARATSKTQVPTLPEDLMPEMAPPPASRGPLVVAALLFTVMGIAAFGTHKLKSMRQPIEELIASPSPSVRVSPAPSVPPAAPSPAASVAPPPTAATIAVAPPPPTMATVVVMPPAPTVAPTPVAMIVVSPGSPGPVTASSSDADLPGFAQPSVIAGASPTPNASVVPVAPPSAAPGVASSPAPLPGDLGELPPAPKVVDISVELWAEGNELEAAELLKSVVGAAPADARTASLLASYLLATNRAPEAAAVLLAALPLSKASRAARLALADAQEEAAQLELAEATYRSVLETSANDGDAQTGLASVKRRRGSIGDAEKILGGVLRADPKNASALYQMGLLRLTGGRNQEAERYFRAAVAYRRDHAAAHAALAKLLDQLGRGQEAVPWYFAAARIDPRYTPDPVRLSALLAQLSKYKEAEEQMRRALVTQPDSVALRKSYGAILSALGRKPESATQVALVAAIEGKKVNVLHDLAVEQSDAKNLDAALACFTAAHKLVPKHAQLIANLATVLARMNRWHEAIQRYREAQKLEPTNDSYAQRIAQAEQVLTAMRSNGTH